MKLKFKSIIAAALCAVGLAAFAGETHDLSVVKVERNEFGYVHVLPAESGYSWTTDADGNPLLVIEAPGLIVTGTTTREHIRLDAADVTLDNLSMDVATNCVVTYRTEPTTVNIGRLMKIDRDIKRDKYAQMGPVKLRTTAPQNSCIEATIGSLTVGGKGNGTVTAEAGSAIAAKGTLAIAEQASLVVVASGGHPAIRGEGGVSITASGEVECRADNAPAIDADGKLTIGPKAGRVVVRGFASGKSGALELNAADAVQLPKGWDVFGSVDIDASIADLFKTVTVKKVSGSDAYTGYIGGDVAKTVTFASVEDIVDPTDVLEWGVKSTKFKHPATPHGKFLEASADAMIANYGAAIAADASDYGARICRALAYLKKAGENETFARLAQEFGFTFDNDAMSFTGELIHEKGVTPEMNDASAEICDILLPLIKSAFNDLDAIPSKWTGCLPITPDVYPVDDAVYFDRADVFCAKAALAEVMCLLDMVKGFDVTMDSDKLVDTFNGLNRTNGKRGVQAILENNPDFFSKVRDQKALTEAGDWWATAARNLDAWDKAQVRRSDGKPHFFMWDFAKLDYKGVTCVDWLHTHRDGLINLPYWASPFDWTLMNGDKAQFWTLQPLFAGKFLRKDFPEFAPGRDEWAPWCNEPLLDTLPDPTLCGMFPGVSRKYIGDLMTIGVRGSDFTTLPPYNTDDSASSVHAIWYDNLFELGFDNSGNPASFAWKSQSPLVLLDPELNVRGVTAVFRGWSFSGYPDGSKYEWEGSEIPTPYTKESPMYKRRNVVATANFDIPKVTYLDFEGGKLSERTDECELVKADTTTFEAGKVYAVPVDVTIPNRITVSGTPASPAKLVLCDGVTLSVTNGIEVADGNALIICGQELGTGTLEATGGSGAAGIGSGGIVTINGGTVDATGGSSGAGIGGGTVTINGGSVTAKGGTGAAGISGTVKFGAGTAYGVAAGANAADARYMTAAAYAADHSAAYVALPYFSLKIPNAGPHYTYEVQYDRAELAGELADGTNTYAVAAGATVKVYFTPEEDYAFDGSFDNPMIIAKISDATAIDLADLPSPTYVPKGSEENPWTVGKTADDSVTVWTNGTDKLVVEGEGDMKDFTEGDPAPWGTGITEVEIGEEVTGIGANAFAGSTSLSSVTVEAMTPPALGDGAFAELPEGFEIYVPTGTGAAYKAAPGWSAYADRIFEGKPGSPTNPWAVGDGVTAYIDENGTLHVEGEGDMKDFTAEDPAPWGASSADIKSIEIGEGVTKVGNCAFIDCSITAPGTFTVDDEDFELNPLAFVSADKTVTNAPATGVFRVVTSESGMAEPVIAFGPKDSTSCSDSIKGVMKNHADWATVQLLTLNATQEREYGYLVSLAGETPYSKAMQKLLDNAKAALDNTKKYSDIYYVVVDYASSISAQAEKDKTNEIEGTDITWRILDGTLIIEGAGDMPDFVDPDFPAGAPWGTDITSVKIGEDVTGIGANAFNDSQLGSVTIPASVTNIGAAAFFCSTSLSNVVVEAMTPPALGEGAFVEVAEGYKICVPTGTGAAYKAAPDWSLYADHIFEQGSPECPWEIGEGVEAYLNGTELVIQGTGTITDLSEIPDSVKDGLTAITITTSDVTGAEAEALAGIGGEGDVAVTLPDNWQGELPKNNSWYGATGVELTRWPMAVKNVKPQQRYPWNGMVDINFNLTGEGSVKVMPTVTVGGVALVNPTVTSETVFDLGGGKELRNLKLVWDAKADFGDEGLHEKIKVKLTVSPAEPE